jgi:GT2 family glycosyltransferase
LTGISVIISAHADERWNDLVAALESVRSQTQPPAETIVVVDRNPALLERARSLPSATCVENVGTPGLGGARNTGVQTASGSVVAFLDDDAVASSGWLEALARAYDTPNVLGAGGSIEPLWAAGKPEWFPDEFGWVIGCTYRGMPESNGSVRNLIGCNMSYRRDLVIQLGGFRLGYGCDETDFCIRLLRRWPHGRLVYVPAARVFHKVTPQRARWKHFRSRCYFEGGSKAVVTWLVGGSDGLASERSYTLRTLPRGVVRGIVETARGDIGGLARAGAIVAGLGITAAGYVAGKFRLREAAERRGWDEGVSSVVR